MEEIKQEPNSQKKKKVAGIVFAVLLVLGAIALFFYLNYAATHISTDDAFVDGHIHSVAPKISGTIKAVYVNDNQMVKKGDLLVEIEPADYESRMNEALASANASKAMLSEIHAKIMNAKAQLELQEANLKQAELDLKRADGLYSKGAISKERYEKTKTGYDVALAEVKAARQQMQQAQSSVATQSSRIKEGESKVQTEKLNLGYTRIYAPVDGMITKKSVEQGNQVQPGQALMAVVPLDDIWVTANYKETQLKKIRPGQKVEIKVDTFSGRTFHGKVDSIMAGTGSVFSLFPPENATGNYVKVVQRVPVKILIEKQENADQKLRVGMSVVPTVIIE